MQILMVMHVRLSSRAGFANRVKDRSSRFGEAQVKLHIARSGSFVMPMLFRPIPAVWTFAGETADAVR